LAHPQRVSGSPSDEPPLQELGSGSSFASGPRQPHLEKHSMPCYRDAGAEKAAGRFQCPRLCETNGAVFFQARRESSHPPRWKCALFVRFRVSDSMPELGCLPGRDGIQCHDRTSGLDLRAETGRHSSATLDSLEIEHSSAILPKPIQVAPVDEPFFFWAACPRGTPD
jgi:hypothetical protein